jgi:hypothetical protein
MFRVLSTHIALMMETAGTCETSVKFYQSTQHNNPEDSHLHTHRREKLRSHIEMSVLRSSSHSGPTVQRKYIHIHARARADTHTRYNNSPNRRVQFPACVGAGLLVTKAIWTCGKHYRFGRTCCYHLQTLPFTVPR